MAEAGVEGWEPLPVADAWGTTQGAGGLGGAGGLELESAAGVVRLADYRGHAAVLLVFMRAFGWPFCRRHLAQLRRRYAEIKARDVEVIAVAPGPREQTDTFAASLPCLADPGRRIFQSYEVESSLFSLGQRPALYAIDGQGIVRYAYLGSQQWQFGDIDEALAALGE